MDVQGHCSGQCLALSVVVPSSPLALIFYSVDAFQLVNRPYGEAHTGPSPPRGRGWGWEGWKTRNPRCGSRPQGFYHPNLPSTQVGTSTKNGSKQDIIEFFYCSP